MNEHIDTTAIPADGSTTEVVEIDQLAEETGAGSFGSAGTLSCPASLGTAGTWG